MAKRVSITRQFDYAAHDVAVGFYETAIKLYGKDCLRGARNEKWVFYRDPLYINNSVKSSPTTHSRAVFGRAVVGNLPGTFLVVPGNNNLIVAEDVPNNAVPTVEKFLDAVQKHLDSASIYRGRAVTTKGEFLDLTGVNENDVVYNEKTKRELKAHVWTIIESQDACRSLGIELPRKILFDGPYGSGKTLAAMITAQKAAQHNWTFVYISPTSAQKERAPLSEVMNFARYYDKPGAVVFIEDIDREQHDRDQYYLGSIVNAIDGIASKTSRVLFIMSTNHKDKIVAAMQRPGRIDKVINFGAYTAEDRKNLLTKVVPLHMLDKTINWLDVGLSCEGFPPAFVKEIGRSAMLFALSENKKSPVVTTEMLIEAATGLQGQFKATSELLGFNK